MTIVSDNVLAFLRKKIDDELGGLSDYLAGNAAKDMEEYRRICGKIEALRWLSLEIVELEQRLDEF